VPRRQEQQREQQRRADEQDDPEVLRVERAAEQIEAARRDVQVDRRVPADAHQRRRDVERDQRREQRAAGADEAPAQVQRVDRDPFAVGPQRGRS